MTERRFVIVLNVGVFVLLLVLVMEVAGMRHLLRRLEHEQRRLVRPSMVTPFAYPIADSFWQNATDGAWILVPPGPCSDCRGPFYHRFFTKEVASAHSPNGTLRLTSSGCGKPKDGPFWVMR